MRYSASKNSATSKTGLGVVQAHWTRRRSIDHIWLYWSAIVNFALSCTVFELFDVEWYHDLEIWVRNHSRPFKMVLFESLGAVCYSPSIVAVALSCISSEIKPDIGRKSWFLPTPPELDAPVRGFPSEYRHHVWYEKTRMVWLPDSEKNFDDMFLMFIRFDTTHERDRQTDTHTDRQTDRQTNTAWRHRPLLCIASRGKTTTT